MRQLFKPDTALIDKLYNENARTILAFVRRQVNSLEEAEDIVLDVFVAALESELLPTLGREKQQAWLHRVARNKCIDYHRRSGRRPAVSLDTFEGMLYDDDNYEPEQVVLQHEEYAQLQQRLTLLTEQQRKVLLLKFGYNLRTPEIARRLHKKESTVRVTLSRALNFLRDVYAKHNERSE